MKKQITYDELESLESDLESRKDQWLRQQGWTYHCDHPGGLWLWHKEIKGRTYMVDQSTAVCLETKVCDDDQFGEPIEG